MNAKVKQLIENKLKEQEQTKKAQREQHLLELGLYEEGNDILWTSRRISPSQSYNAAKDMFFSYGKLIEVTDDEYNELCKFYPEGNNFTGKEYNNKYTSIESTLKTVAAIMLGLGLLFCLVFVIVVCGLEDMGPLTLLAIPMFLSILSIWALCRCIAHISFTLRQIEHKLKK